jgi:hypothetical protein
MNQKQYVRIKEEDLKPIEELETVPVIAKHILTSMARDGSLLVVDIGDKEYALHLLPYESTYVTFVLHGYTRMAHMPSIYQLYTSTMKDIGCDLIKCVIEGVSGDVMYARMTWADKNHRRFSNLCSVADAIVVSHLVDRPLNILAKLVDSLDTTDNLDYEYYQYDEWDDDSEYYDE